MYPVDFSKGINCPKVQKEYFWLFLTVFEIFFCCQTTMLPNAEKKKWVNEFQVPCWGLGKSHKFSIVQKFKKILKPFPLKTYLNSEIQTILVTFYTNIQNVQKQETDLDYAIWFNFCQKNEICFLDKRWTKQKRVNILTGSFCSVHISSSMKEVSVSVDMMACSSKLG